MTEHIITADAFNSWNETRDKSLDPRFANAENWPTAFDHIECLLDDVSATSANRLSQCGLRVPYDNTIRYDPTQFDAVECVAKRIKYNSANVLRALAIIREYHAKM